MTDTSRPVGLYSKFIVQRRDGRDRPGEDKDNAQYFVLDYVNDPFARRALRRYAEVARQECPLLAEDLLARLEATE